MHPTLARLGVVLLIGAGTLPLHADIVRLADLELDAAKAPRVIADFYRKIIKAAKEPDAAVPAARLGLDLVEAILKDKDIPLNQALPAAEQALRALAWLLQENSHDASDVRRQVDDKLLDVRQQRLKFLANDAKQANSWQNALAFADSMLDQYPRSLAVGKQVRSLWAECALADSTKARPLWLRSQRLFLDNSEMRPVQEILEKRARQALDDAATLGDGPAREKLSQGLKLWPRLPGLLDAWLHRDKKYFILYVGVRQLPEFLSPATACTEAEKHALDLLFESLVQPADEAGTLQTHEARLAAALPEPRPLLRHIALRRDAYWSSGQRVLPSDVRHSVLLATDGKLAGRDSTWRDFFDVPEVDGNSFALDFRIKKGLFDPLALLSFKVLPQTFRNKPLHRGDDAEFARSPVGSGPFVYMGRREIDGRTCAIFTANPQHVRGDLAEEPRIREIRMFAWKDAKDLASPEARRALLLDVPTELLSTVTNIGTYEVRTLRPRRVHFLAVNQRVPALANESLRRALAHAIDREAILQRYFRGKRIDTDRLAPLGMALVLPLLSLPARHIDSHSILNGPYPLDSWASAANVPRDLHDVTLARSLFRQAIKGQKIKLTLKHPDDDPRLAPALHALARQIEKAASDVGTGLQIVPIGMSNRAFKEAIARRDYELAYAHWDYESATYWLWPLFDPQPAAVQPGGSNYLGYDNDAILQNLFRTALGHRQFTALQTATHNIHAHLSQKKMPLVPLWQLDAHVAIPAGLTTGALDPLRVFANVARWQYSMPTR